MFSLDDRKDEGLRFPPAAQKLELLLLHELGRLKYSRGPADEKLAAMVSEADMMSERLRDIFIEPFKRLHEDLFLVPIKNAPHDIDRNESPDPGSVISTMNHPDLPSETYSNSHMQQIESPTSTVCCREEEMGTATPSAQPAQDTCHSRVLLACSSELPQVMTLPSSSSDSHSDTQMMCHAPESCGQSFCDDWSDDECAKPANDGTDELSRLRKNPGDEIKPQIVTRSSTTPPQCSAPHCPGEDIRAGRPPQREYILPSEQGHQSDDVQKKRDDQPPRLGPGRTHFGSGHLLSQFMAMTGAKPRATHSSSRSPKSSTTSLSRAKTEKVKGVLVSNTEEVCSQKSVPAMTPQISSLSETGRCLISVQLGPSVIRHLEEFWPVDCLIDRDFCSHMYIGNKRLDNGSVVMQSTTFRVSEVDIPLTVEDGIIVTTLLQIRQKPLPGSTVQTAIRQRVSNLSRKYRKLTILVFESSQPKDVMSDLSPKDIEIYREFVCFASSMEASVTVHLVSGGDKTLGRWILSLMIPLASRLKELDKMTAIGNTTWELFFRQTGMNVRAAQVLSQSLFEEFGTSGITAFLTMIPPERMEYGRKLGIERHVTQCASVLAILNLQVPEPSSSTTKRRLDSRFSCDRKRKHPSGNMIMNETVT
ncbi:hypothetical protein E4U57_007615 [Claviceps arundinis]|uniref:Uncharacterized protein n=1 Tax=Claviceps arundinis TaxID=1623583 RepID=A0ABQ7PMY4_9HYPO|nr:hypothetical protein E4U57_007615 [Claviceps arundinis]